MTPGTPQDGFIADNPQAALFLTLTVQDAEQAVVRVREIFALFPDRVAALRDPVAGLDAVVGAPRPCTPFPSFATARAMPQPRPATSICTSAARAATSALNWGGNWLRRWARRSR